MDPYMWKKSIRTYIRSNKPDRASASRLITLTSAKSISIDRYSTNNLANQR